MQFGVVGSSRRLDSPAVKGKTGWFCDQCVEVHTERVICDKCGACMYKHSKQIPDDNWPIGECLKCGFRFVWD